jgi:uncharacterized NAD(P)/FAD-binding protein YdhS
VPTKVVDVERRADGRLDVVQPSGARLAFDDVIVATGYGPTPGQRKFAHVESPLVVRDPYAAGALDVIPARGAILVVGTGLAAIDVILTLGTERPSQPIVAISRRGRTPALHHTTSTSSPLDWHAESRTARELVREVRVTIDAVETEGGDWRTVFDALRHQVPDIWRALPLRESQRLLRHARRPWELHRHRLAPAVASQFNRLLTGGRVCIKRGTPVDVTAAMDRLSVTIMGQGTTSVVEAAAMVLCTGAVDHDWVGADPLLARLVERSLAAPHPLDIGPDVGPTGRFIGPDGEPVAGLWTIGPLRRAAEWETTAIPEIRRQAAQLAALISASSPPPQEIEPVQIRLVR